jgi:uncharacterized protein with HEPN domain
MEEIQTYLNGKTVADFQSHSMLKFASIKQLEIIGEASRYITDQTKQKFHEVEWEQIIGLRNILVHEYFGIDTDLVWQIINTDMPLFKDKISVILNSLK